MLSEGLRQEVKPANIRTTIISPGAVQSELPQSITAPDVAKGIQHFHENLRHDPAAARTQWKNRHVSFGNRQVVWTLGQPYGSPAASIAI